MTTARFDTSFIPDLPPSHDSLVEYRKNAQFDWKRLRVFFEGEECLRVKYDIWNRLEKDPLFAKSSVTPSAEDQKRLAALRMKRVLEASLLPEEVKNAPYQKRVRKLVFSATFKLNILPFSSVEVHDEPERSLPRHLSQSFDKNGPRHRPFLQCFDSSRK